MQIKQRAHQILNVVFVLNVKCNPSPLAISKLSGDEVKAGAKKFNHGLSGWRFRFN